MAFAKGLAALGVRLLSTGGTARALQDAGLEVVDVGTYTGFSSNFIVRIGGRLIVNELLGTTWGQTRYDGTLLTGGGGTVSSRAQR